MLATPHLRAVGRTSGRTFELTSPLPEPGNGGGRPPTKEKPAGKPPRKNSNSTPPRKGTPKAKQRKPRPEPATAEVKTKLGEPPEQERKRSRSPDQKECARKSAQEKRHRARDLGLLLMALGNWGTGAAESCTTEMMTDGSKSGRVATLQE